MKPHGQRRSDLTAFAGIAIFFLAFFAEALLGKRFIIAGDAFYYSYPLRTVAWDMIRAGQLPLWTPHVLAGYPLLSMAQLAVGYPLTWGYLFLPGHWAEQLYVLAPFLLSPIFTYAYLRELGRSQLASLFGGLSFGYGGMMCSFISNSGMLTNSLMWAPLMLLYVERARTRSLLYCLPRAAFVYALSVLAGHGQSYVYVAILVNAYGLYLSLTALVESRSWQRLGCWKPLAVSAGATFLATGIAAFQLLETLRVARRSTRSSLSYEVFGEGSFQLSEAILSIGAPLYHYIDTSAYLTPPAVLLATMAVVTSARQPKWTTTRVWFWLLAALVAFVLLLGKNTPIYRIVFYLPVLNQFRVPSRHTFEWTLAISALAAYGWDATSDFLSRRYKEVSGDRFVNLLLTTLLALGAVVIAMFWWRATGKPPAPNPSIYTGLPESHYWLWKTLFTGVVLVLAWQSFRLRNVHARSFFLAATIVLACFVESSATISSWWGRLLSLPKSRIHAVAPTTTYLQQFPANQNRVYTRVGLFAEEFTATPRLDAPNLHALFGLHNLAGMEPLILDRYSRALGGVGPDSVTPRAGFPPNDYLFSARSHVLDILNTKHVVSFAGLKPYDEPLVYKDGIGLSAFGLSRDLAPGAAAVLSGSASPSDELILVTSLANSVAEHQGTEIGRVRLQTDDGSSIELSLKAGVDTSEWAYDRPDVKAAIKHQRAVVFSTRPADANNTFGAHQYWTRLSLGKPQRVTRIEIQNTSKSASLVLWRAALFNSETRVSDALFFIARSEFWTTVYDKDSVQILKNSRSLPRAWLVADVEVVDGEEALRRIMGESATEFNPLRTALLEAALPDWLHLPRSELPAECEARIVTYESNRLVVETKAPIATVLILSEIFYPGWEASVDGKESPILLADYLLRGIALPAGQHRIEMSYRAPAARVGAVISAFTLVLLIGLTLNSRWSTRHDARQQDRAGNKHE